MKKFLNLYVSLIWDNRLLTSQLILLEKQGDNFLVINEQFLSHRALEDI